MGHLGRVCHQPNLFNELHKTVHEKKLGLRSHSRYKRSPPECPAMSPHERVKLTNYVERMLCLVRFFGPNYIAPSPIIAHFVDTEDLVYEYVDRSFVCVCVGGGWEGESHNHSVSYYYLSLLWNTAEILKRMMLCNHKTSKAYGDMLKNHRPNFKICK